jgi:hypothetical protein
MVVERSDRVESCQFGYPTPRFPFYHIKAMVRPESSHLNVHQFRVDGEETRDFQVFRGNRERFDRVVEQGVRSVIVARVDWENGRSYALEISGKSTDGQDRTLVHRTGKAPSYGGYWDRDWKYYAGVVLAEKTGVPRYREPVHLTLSLYGDRIEGPGEIRVLGIHPETGTATETPCQIYGFDRWSISKLIEEEAFRYQPTVTVDLVFLADVPALAQKVYLIFYGNPKAKTPSYETDLKMDKEATEVKIENDYYRMSLHDKSGLIDEITIKQGVNTTLAHHVESPGTLHWNPDCYSPPKTWSHTSEWNPPPHLAVTEGPVFVMRKYWGKLPFGVEGVFASVTYRFYAHNPYVVISTAMRVDEPMGVKVLRNGCFVFKRDLFDAFIWKDRDGRIGRSDLAEAPSPPNPVRTIAADSPWMAFVNHELGFGFGGITLSYLNERFDQGLVRATEPCFHIMVGPWVTWARLLVNTFMTNNPQRLVQLPEGCLYMEKTAYLPFAFNRSEEKQYAVLERYHRILTTPLEVTGVHMDTDQRVPREWVPALLAEPFEVNR